MSTRRKTTSLRSRGRNWASRGSSVVRMPPPSRDCSLGVDPGSTRVHEGRVWRPEGPDVNGQGPTCSYLTTRVNPMDTALPGRTRAWHAFDQWNSPGRHRPVRCSSGWVTAGVPPYSRSKAEPLGGPWRVSAPFRLLGRSLDVGGEVRQQFVVDAVEALGAKAREEAVFAGAGHGAPGHPRSSAGAVRRVQAGQVSPPRRAPAAEPGRSPPASADERQPRGSSRSRCSRPRAGRAPECGPGRRPGPQGR